MDAKDEFEDFGDKDEVIVYEAEPSNEDVIEMHQPDEELQIVFKLPPLPGSDAHIPIEVCTDDDIEIKEDKNDLKTKEDIDIKDPSDWRHYEARRLPEWAQYMFNNIPRHSGRETTGIERVISYLKKFDGDLSRAISNDYKGEADIAKLEEARKEIYDGIQRLEEAQDKLEQTHYRKKKADFVKEAKQTTVGGIIITVPLHISAIARVCINSMVSAGKDIEIVANTLIKKYNLNDRDQLELLTLLSDMGYFVRKPRTDFINEPFDTTSVDNVDYMANYFA